MQGWNRFVILMLGGVRCRVRGVLRGRVGLWGGVLPALMGVLVLVVGIAPTPGAIADVLRGVFNERYPCEGSSCGCSSAHECWTSCQCQSMAAKVAWAEREGVAIPGYVPRAELAACAEVGGSEGGHCPLCRTGGDAETESGEEGGEAEDDWWGPRLCSAVCGDGQLFFAIGSIPGIRACDVELAPVRERQVLVVGGYRMMDGVDATEAPEPPPRG